jgi:hypothetical protein
MRIGVGLLPDQTDLAALVDLQAALWIMVDLEPVHSLEGH